LQKKKNIDSFNRMKEYATNESSIYKTFKKTDLITEKIFTTKKMLRECYPYGTLACSKDSIVELHTTSGSTGKPSVSFYTHEDIRTTKEYISKSWANFGVDKDSVVMFMLSYGLFSGAALNTYAVQELGALVVPAGINSASKHIEMIIDFGVDTLVTTPSYLHYLITFINENNINKNQFNIKRIIVAGEFASIALKKSFGDYFSCRVFDHYGLCEVNTGVIYECIECGKNVAIKDYVFAEVVDGSGSETNLKGELVLTSLIKEASPVLRYRTGDGSTLMNDLSRCKNCFGSQVLERISGRVDGTIFYKGLKIDLAELKSFIINEVNFAIHQNSHFKLYVDKVDNVKEIVFCTKITQNFSEIEKSTLVKKVSNALKNGCSVQISLDIEILDSESIKLDNKVKLYEKSEI
jgi:phenylacetate-CoA ligase